MTNGQVEINAGPLSAIYPVIAFAFSSRHTHREHFAIRLRSSLPETTKADYHGSSRHSVSAFLGYVDEAGQQLLKQRFPTGELFARGANVAKNGSNKTQWDKIVGGDVALFLRHNKVVGRGKVVYKLRSADLSRGLGWEQDNHSDLPYELIYVVEDVEPLTYLCGRSGRRSAMSLTPIRWASVFWTPTKPNGHGSGSVSRSRSPTPTFVLC